MRRRKFLKTVGGAAGAAALGGCSTVDPQSKSSVSKASKRTKKHRKQENTYVVGEVVPNSHPYKRDNRMPGWFPDAQDKGTKNYFLFQEEAYKHDSAGSFPFKLPPPVKPDASWIIGGKIPDAPQTNFAWLIQDFAKAIRLYNVTLYELRRYHFQEKSIDLPKNPKGNPHSPENLPAFGTPAFDSLAGTAEDNWHDAAEALGKLIDPPDLDNPPRGLELVAVDMVQVNNYIVSMRLVTRPSGKQIGGSDSSHVSISSAFSSP